MFASDRPCEVHSPILQRRAYIRFHLCLKLRPLDVATEGILTVFSNGWWMVAGLLPRVPSTRDALCVGNATLQDRSALLL